MSTETSHFVRAIHSAEFSFERVSVAEIRDACETAPTPVADSDWQLWQSGRYQELCQRLSSELNRAESAADGPSLLAITNNLACVFRALGDLDSAARFQQQAAIRELELSESHGLSTTSLSNLACDAFLAGDLRTAEGLFWKSLLGELAAGDDAAAGADWANLALIANLQDDVAACRWRFWQALKRHRSGCDQYGVALDLWHLGQSFESTGSWSICRRLFKRAEEMFQELGHDALHQEARTRGELAMARERVTTFDVDRN